MGSLLCSPRFLASGAGSRASGLLTIGSCKIKCFKVDLLHVSLLVAIRIGLQVSGVTAAEFG